MSECRYCYEPILDGQDLYDSNTHRGCNDERLRRNSARECWYCRKNSDGRLCCNGCFLTDNEIYSGYKGPGQ